MAGFVHLLLREATSRRHESAIPRMPAPSIHTYHRWTGSDHARYGDGTKQCTHYRGAFPVAGSIRPGGPAGRQLGGPDHLLHLHSHVDIPAHVSIAVNQQIGIPLLLAALAALFGEDEVFSEGVVKLASNNRCADQRDRIEARNRAIEERNRSAQERECTARRARIQARLAAAQCRFLLADSPRNRLQLSETLALLLEDPGN